MHSRNKCDSVVQLGDVSISDTGILLVMSQFKNNTSGRPVTLSILQTKDIYCPVHSLSQFLKVRGPAKGHCLHLRMHPRYLGIYFVNI